MKVEEIKTLEVRDDDGEILSQGDLMLIKVRMISAACYFHSADKNYLRTTTIFGDEVNYRLSSIEECRKLRRIEFADGQYVGLVPSPAEKEKEESNGKN